MTIPLGRYFFENMYYDMRADYWAIGQMNLKISHRFWESWSLIPTHT